MPTVIQRFNPIQLFYCYFFILTCHSHWRRLISFQICIGHWTVGDVFAGKHKYIERMTRSGYNALRNATPKQNTNYNNKYLSHCVYVCVVCLKASRWDYCERKNIVYIVLKYCSVILLLVLGCRCRANVYSMRLHWFAYVIFSSALFGHCHL